MLWFRPSDNVREALCFPVIHQSTNASGASLPTPVLHPFEQRWAASPHTSIALHPRPVVNHSSHQWSICTPRATDASLPTPTLRRFAILFVLRRRGFNDDCRQSRRRATATSFPSKSPDYGVAQHSPPTTSSCPVEHRLQGGSAACL